MYIRKRNIVTCVVLSLVTCGIYLLYWWYCIADEMYHSGAPDAPRTSPLMVIVLSFLTCGIYDIYCVYKWGKAMQQMYAARGQYAEDRSVMYLLLSLFKLEIIIFALLQDDLNRLADMPPPMDPYGHQYTYGQQPYGNPNYPGGPNQYAAQQPQYDPQGQPYYNQQPQQPYNPGQYGQPNGQQSNQDDFIPPPNSPYNP